MKIEGWAIVRGNVFHDFIEKDVLEAKQQTPGQWLHYWLGQMLLRTKGFNTKGIEVKRATLTIEDGDK